MTHYDKNELKFVFFASLLVMMPTLFFVGVLVCCLHAPETLSAYVLVVLEGAMVAAILWCLPGDYEISTGGEESDNTEDNESAEVRNREEYKEDETDLYDIIVNKPAETTDDTAETVAEDETDDKA